MAKRNDINERQKEELPLAEALEAERKARRNARARQRRAEKKAKKEFWIRTNRNVEWLDTSLLDINEGQMEGLPKNPRSWTKDELNKLKKSLEETPELFEARPILAYDYDGRLLVLGGNMRLSAAKALGMAKVPVYVYPSSTPLEKLKEIVIKDNGAFGAWDWDMLANEWDALPLSEWGVPAWNGDTTEDNTKREVEEDNFDEEKEEIHVMCKRGDIWQLGEHRLMCGDSVSLDDVKKLMGGQWLT